MCNYLIEGFLKILKLQWGVITLGRVKMWWSLKKQKEHLVTKKRGVLLTDNNIEPLGFYRDQVSDLDLAHTSLDSPSTWFCLLIPWSTHYASETHNDRQTLESPDSYPLLLSHTRIRAKDQFHSMFTKVFTPESTSSLFVSIHRTSTVSIKPLTVSLLKLICNNKSTRFTRRSGKREASS
jgi:hypothetical protein